MGKLQCPCKDCPDRHIKCHASCERYGQYCKLNNEKRDKDYKDRLIGMQLYEMHLERNKNLVSNQPLSIKHGRKKK